MNARDPALTKRKLDSRHEIINAAAICIMKYGLEKATMDTLARELGSTKGRVYHHFRSKNEVCFAVYHQAMQFCFDAVEPIVTRPGPANEKLLAMATAHGKVMMDSLPFQRSIRQGVNAYLHGPVIGPDTEAERKVLAELIARRNAYEDLYRMVLQQGVDDGSLSMPDVAIAGRAIMGALNSLVDWYRERPGQSRANKTAIADTLARTVINGLLT